MAPPPTVWPGVHAHDAPGLINFLVRAFGFIEVVRVGEGDMVLHAELAWPAGGGIMLGSLRPDETPGSPGTPGTLMAYAVHPDPDALYRQAMDAGAIVVSGPEDTGYGSRQVTLADPEGNHWSFGTYAGGDLSDPARSGP